VGEKSDEGGMMEWIKVEIREPSVAAGHLCSVDVLVGHFSWPEVRVGYLDGYKRWRAYIFNGDMDEETVEPSHWMPLPEPPKEI
jgi:hypothetical protein